MSKYKDMLNLNAKSTDMLYEISNAESKGLKNALLMIYDDIYKVCEKYGIKPVMIAGTALGAIRHKGFIPWDDDLDIAMERSEYELFLDKFVEEMGDRYELMSPRRTRYVDNRFSQIYLKGTVYKTVNDNQHKIQGIYVDLFPIDYAPSNKILQEIKGIPVVALMGVAACVTLYQYRNDTMKKFMGLSRKSAIMYSIKKSIGFLFSWKKCEEWFAILDRKVQYKKSEYCGILIDEQHYFKEIRKTELFFPYTEATFENRKVYVPHDVHTYLGLTYGDDYMVVPPVEKRQRHFIVKLILPEEFT